MDASATDPADGHIVVIGGVDSNADPVYTVEVYDPGTGVFTITDVDEHGIPCTAALLPNGHILILGGNVPGSGPVLAYEYVPSMGKFLLTGNGRPESGAPAGHPRERQGPRRGRRERVLGAPDGLAVRSVGPGGEAARA